MNLAAGILIGVGITLMAVLLLGFLVQEYLNEGGPFRDATVKDFQDKTEGGK